MSHRSTKVYIIWHVITWIVRITSQQFAAASDDIKLATQGSDKNKNRSHTDIFSQAFIKTCTDSVAALEQSSHTHTGQAQVLAFHCRLVSLREMGTGDHWTTQTTGN